jgi:hypothetical protein
MARPVTESMVESFILTIGSLMIATVIKRLARRSVKMD